MTDFQQSFQGAAESLDSTDSLNTQWPNQKESRSPSSLATASFVLGLISCILNAMLLTSPVGAILSLLGLIFGWVSIRREKQGYPGLVLSLFSILVMMIWVLTVVAILLNDPTFTLSL
ncbi:DUF4190 domain-containing protein [Ferviditalea candida]|uniref:DUF4190 domain-containing protein n=1 Tax=Ferviditalea candida TaxID=3108399 RepID=A0ABU5ZMA1_9BACL|nr:DUF4190 domain-containing protein [Paenibacillaceae bacterium T2]